MTRPYVLCFVLLTACGGDSTAPAAPLPEPTMEGGWVGTSQGYLVLLGQGSPPVEGSTPS